MGIITVDKKAPAEIIPVAFDFSSLVSAIDSVIITITVKSGADPDVGTMPLSSAIITDATVKQLIRNGLDANVYRIRADIMSGSEKYSLAMYLPVCEVAA